MSRSGRNSNPEETAGIEDGMQESVWDYPRPPRLEQSDRLIRVEFKGAVIAESRQALRILETSHAPSWYIPPSDVDLQYLSKNAGRHSHCEWKGAASYYSVVHAGERVENAAWCYDNPLAPYAAIRGHFAFYPNLLDCFVDDEKAASQPGGFYGGWITPDLVGPFKGAPGTHGW